MYCKQYKLGWRTRNEARVRTASNTSWDGGLGMRLGYVLQAIQAGMEDWE